MSNGVGAALRAWGLALSALAAMLLGYWDGQSHGAAGFAAPAESFSAARAEAVLVRLLGPERPHPAGSAENAAVRARILKEFARLGVSARSYRAFTCNAWHKFSTVACGTVTDIVADAIPGKGKAIVLLAHYDSVPAGPGASDDESGVATVLETIHALKARGGKSLHPVTAVITDGEEGGLLGANAFLQDAALRDRVGAVVNVEARGTRGRSLLFQTSPGDGRLIDLYAANVPVYATSSLYAEIYRFLPNDTDLTLFIRDGFPSFNFAFVDNVRYYHSPFDLRANLDPATLQMQGDNMLGVAVGLERTDYSALKGGNDVYIGLFGVALPRMKAGLALPLAAFVFLAIAAAAWLARRKGEGDWRGVSKAAAMPLVLLIGGASFGWLLSIVAQIVSHHADPSYAHPLAMRIALGFGVWAVTLALSRMAAAKSSAAAVWLWMAGLGVVTAAFLPGVSPYFVFPALVAAVLSLAASARGGWAGGWGQAALLLSALAAFALWLPLAASGESLMGLRLHPLFTVPAAFALMTAVPLLAANSMTVAAWRASTAFSAFAAVASAVIAGFLPAYSAASPQRVNLVYFENGNAPARFIAATAWKALSTEPIPAPLMKAGGFRYDAEAWAGLGFGDGYAAPAGRPRYPRPAASVTGDRREGADRIVTVALRGSRGADGMIVHIPKDARLAGLDVRGQHLASQGYEGDTQLLCVTSDCRDLDITFKLASHRAVVLPFAEFHYGLPGFAAKLKEARPRTAMPSQSGDETVLADRVMLPAR